MTEKQWFLQVVNGQQFWDDYIHSGCRLLSSWTLHQPYTPFNPPPPKVPIYDNKIPEMVSTNNTEKQE